MKCGCDPHVESCPVCRAWAKDRQNRDRGWRKCSEEMPPENKAEAVRVLTWDGHRVQESRRYWDGLMHVFRWDDCYRMPTYWMPLPDPPAA